MDKKYTINPNHFSATNLDHDRLLKLFYRDYPTLKEHHVIFAFLSHDLIPSILIFDYEHDCIDEYSHRDYQLIARHGDAGLETIKQTTSFFQESIFTPKITRLGTTRHFRYEFILQQYGTDDKSLYLWDDVTDPRIIKLYDTSNDRSSIFTTDDELDLYLYLFQHYDFKIIGVDGQDVFTLINKNSVVEIAYDLCYHDPNNKVRKSTSFRIDHTDPYINREYIKRCLKVLILILKENNLDQIKQELKSKQDFIYWLRKNVTSDCIKLRED